MAQRSGRGRWGAWCSWLASGALHALVGVGSLLGATWERGAAEGSRVQLHWAGLPPPPEAIEPPEAKPPQPPELKPPEEKQANEAREREWTLGVDVSDAVTSTWVGVAPEWAGEAVGRLAEVEQGAFALPEGSETRALGASGSPGGAPAEISLAPQRAGGAGATSQQGVPGAPGKAEERVDESAAKESEATPATAGRIEKQEEAKSAPVRGERDEGATDARGEREGLEEARRDDGGREAETKEARDATSVPPVSELESRGTAKEPTSAREERSSAAEAAAAEGVRGSDGAPGQGEGTEGGAMVIPPGQGGDGGGVVEISTQGQVSDRESEATALKDRVKVTPGQPVAAKGLEIKTRRPVFSLYTRVTAAPRNAVVRVRFTREGKVASAEMVRSSGVADVDRPILDAVYGWTASGKKLLELPETREGEKRATVSMVFEIVLR